MEIVFFFQSTTRTSWRSKLAGVYRFAQSHGWFIHVIDHQASPDEIRSCFRNWNPIGCLVDCALGVNPSLNRFFSRVPTVFLDHGNPNKAKNHPHLIHDSSAEVALIGRELFNLNCRSYAYLGTGKNYFWDRERLERFRLDVHAQGATFCELSRAKLKATLAKLPKPCGILAANDLCALEVHHAAIAGGLAIPGEIALAGIDNDEMLCESVSPGLTSAEPDFEGAGYRLAEMLAEEIARRGSSKSRSGVHPVEHYGPLKLVRRGSTASATQLSARVRRALEFIRRHAYDRSLSLDGIAAEMRCSRRLATLSFRNETGHTILDEIHDLRIAHACELLSNTSLPIETITANCGYVSSSFFKKQFVQRTGQTMRNYRNARWREKVSNPQERPLAVKIQQEQPFDGHATKREDERRPMRVAKSATKTANRTFQFLTNR